MITVPAPMVFQPISGKATPRLLPIPPLWAHRQLRVTPAKCLGIHVLYVVHSLGTANQGPAHVAKVHSLFTFRPATQLPRLTVLFGIASAT